MNYGLDVAILGDWSDPELIAELAVEAEAAGWDGFFVWEILLPDGDPATPVADPWIALAAVASRTQRIRIGALVTPLPRRHAAEVAKQVATLDALSGGRVTFGGGLGWKDAEFEALGLDPDRRARAAALDDGLGRLVRWWSGEDADGILLRPTPVQRPRPPIWLAAGLPRRRPLERAAGWDGVYLMTLNQVTDAYLTPGEVREAVEVVRGIAGDRPVDVAVNTEPSDGDAALARARAAEMAEAGATWVCELTPETVEEHRALIRRGPPRPI